jgi:hypothetical protein
MIGHICVMTRMALLLLLTALLFTRTAPAADRTLAAEGDYIQGGAGNRALSHWKLWHLRKGGYEVVETMARPHVVQVFTFDAEFLPSGFSLTIDPGFKLPAAQRPRFDDRTIISCQYHVHDLTCNSENNGKKSLSSIPAEQPYVLAPGNFYALDYTWFLTGVLRLIEHNDSADSTVNVFVIVEGGIHRDLPIKLTYAGDVTVPVMGKEQSVTEYEGQVGKFTLSEVWGLPGLSILQVNSQGLVVAVREKLNPTVRFSISNYKEYASWQPRR